MEGSPGPRTIEVRLRHQHLVDHHDHAVTLIDVGNRHARRITLLVCHGQIRAAAAYRQGAALHRLELRLAATGFNVPIEFHRIERTRHHVIGQDLAQFLPVLRLQQVVDRAGRQGCERLIGPARTRCRAPALPVS